jgi:hypothetical protein
MSNYSTEKKEVVRPPSDGSELIPAEVSGKVGDSGQIPLKKPLTDGYTIDEEGLANNYAVEPQEYRATYPAPYEQRRYLFQGAIAIVFIAFIVWVAFAVS